MPITAPPRILFLHDLSQAWQDLILRCMRLGFAELHNCQVEDNCIVKVKRVLQRHAPPWNSHVLPDLSKPLSRNWVYLYDLCHERDGRRFALIKLDAGQPALIQSEEGGWAFKEA